MVGIGLLGLVVHTTLGTLAFHVNVFAFGILLPNGLMALADFVAVCVAAAVGEVFFFAAAIPAAIAVEAHFLFAFGAGY